MIPKKTRNYLRYRRQYRRREAPLQKKQKRVTVFHTPVEGRYTLTVLRDCFNTVERVTRGLEHVLARRSKCFRYRPSTSKYTRHQGLQEMARRVARMSFS